MVDEKFYEKDGIHINKYDGTRRLASNLITVMRKRIPLKSRASRAYVQEPKPPKRSPHHGKDNRKRWSPPRFQNPQNSHRQENFQRDNFQRQSPPSFQPHQRSDNFQGQSLPQFNNQHTANDNANYQPRNNSNIAEIVASTVAAMTMMKSGFGMNNFSQ